MSRRRNRLDPPKRAALSSPACLILTPPGMCRHTVNTSISPRNKKLQSYSRQWHITLPSPNTLPAPDLYHIKAQAKNPAMPSRRPPCHMTIGDAPPVAGCGVLCGVGVPRLPPQFVVFAGVPYGPIAAEVDVISGVGVTDCLDAGARIGVLGRYSSGTSDSSGPITITVQPDESSSSDDDVGSGYGGSENVGSGYGVIGKVEVPLFDLVRLIDFDHIDSERLILESIEGTMVCQPGGGVSGGMVDCGTSCRPTLSGASVTVTVINSSSFSSALLLPTVGVACTEGCKSVHCSGK